MRDERARNPQIWAEEQKVSRYEQRGAGQANKKRQKETDRRREGEVEQQITTARPSEPNPARRRKAAGWENVECTWIERRER